MLLSECPQISCFIFNSNYFIFNSKRIVSYVEKSMGADRGVLGADIEYFLCDSMNTTSTNEDTALRFQK